jgi:hypothetical protein
MENELLDLADRLCTVAGMIMEDNNLIAIAAPKSAEERQIQIQAVAVAGGDIAVLMAAASVLSRLG